jgi:hypothetical protein
MGLLDDAIREHLELKKRHGADQTEIADLEREAFGPARRGPEPLEVPGETAADADAAAAPAAPAAAEETVPPEVVPPEQPVASEGLPEPAALDADVPAQSVPQPEPDPVAEELAWEDAATEPEEPASTSEGDVLEETPEFLEETPEHDRLWFEQRPPRDFDFDG